MKNYHRYRKPVDVTFEIKQIDHYDDGPRLFIMGTMIYDQTYQGRTERFDDVRFSIPNLPSGCKGPRVFQMRIDKLINEMKGFNAIHIPRSWQQRYDCVYFKNYNDAKAAMEFLQERTLMLRLTAR